MLGSGARMQVYPLVDERTVLRVPRRSEQQLIDEHGSSGRKALATGHEVSVTTETELHDIEAMEGFIGAFVPDSTPFADLDLVGDFRYYCLQRRVKITRDLRLVNERLPLQASRRSLERFIRDVRDMVNELGLVPDLAGRGNLVLDAAGLVKLIDVNNFRRLVPCEELEACFSDDDEIAEYAASHKRIEPALPVDFVDDLGHPVGDLTLQQLRTLEVRGLARDYKAVDRDPFYAPLRNERRQKVLALLKKPAA
ncbi:MAG: hypothetical protein KC503_02655 [Myxococcales bacterium]|nr:hypothetical protein [Myxococcales bacterium]